MKRSLFNVTIRTLRDIERKMDVYKCVKSFSLEVVDGDGFLSEDEYMTVETGSVWHLPEDEDSRLIGGQIRLESDEDCWIEISWDTLEECFKVMQKD